MRSFFAGRVSSGLTTGLRTRLRISPHTSFPRPYFAASFMPPWYSPIDNSWKRSFCTGKAPVSSDPPQSPPETLSPDSFTDIPGVKSAGDKYAMVYTCKVCDTRAAKVISKQAYHHGTVLLRCPGCQNLHLIADHLGQFEERGWNVEDFLAEQGDKVKRVANDDVLELTLKDVTGEK